MAFIKLIIKVCIGLSSPFYFTAHLHIFMTYLKEIKIEAECSHETDFCYGRANGGK